MIKNMFRPLYQRSKALQALNRAILLRRHIRLARMELLPFNGDAILRQTVDVILADQITQFVETGTYLGHTCRYLASKHPDLPIMTIEYNELYYQASQTTLSKLPNVIQILGDSGEVIQHLVQKDKIDGLPFFFLDAHWGTMPLPIELRILSQYLSSAVVLIHDFQVPGRQDYGFDVFNGRAIGMEMLRESILPDRLCELFLPQYTYHDAYQARTENEQSLRGHALLFWGDAQVIARFRKSECSRYYVRQTLW